MKSLNCSNTHLCPTILGKFSVFYTCQHSTCFLSACRLTKLPAGKEVPKNSVCHYIFLLLKFLSTQIYMGQEKPKHFFYKSCLARHKWFYLFVPTLWFGAMSIVSVAESCLTANPRSAMQHVPFFFTNIFFDFKSLWAIAGLPVREKNKSNISVKKTPNQLAFILSLEQNFVWSYRIPSSSDILRAPGYLLKSFIVDCLAVQESAFHVYYITPLYCCFPSSCKYLLCTHPTQTLSQLKVKKMLHAPLLGAF